MSIVIYATEVSCITGDNKFKPLAECFEDMVKRYNPSLYREYNFGSSEDTVRNLYSDIITSVVPQEDNTRGLVVAQTDCLKKVKTQIKSDQAELQKGLQTEGAKRAAALPDDVKSAVQAVTQSAVRCGHGVRKENSVLEWYAARYNCKVSQPTQFFKAKLLTTNGYVCFVGGRVDGLRGDGVVIEIKSRTRRLYKTLWPAEKMQLQTYLHILGAPHGDLVESVVTAEGIDRFVIHCGRDETTWAKTEARLHKYCNYLTRFLGKVDMKYINSSQRTQYLHDLLDD